MFLCSNVWLPLSRISFITFFISLIGIRFSMHIFNIKGAKFCIFVYFCIFEIVNQFTRILDIISVGQF
jgi:hypothetical protein